MTIRRHIPPVVPVAVGWKMVEVGLLTPLVAEVQPAMEMVLRRVAVVLEVR
jgi:hypothetical protein